MPLKTIDKCKVGDLTSSKVLGRNLYKIGETEEFWSKENDDQVRAKVIIAGYDCKYHNFD